MALQYFRKRFDHRFGDGPFGSAACIHIDQFHPQHFSRHCRTHGNFIFVGRNRDGIADIRNRRGRSAIDNDITGRHDLQAALPYKRAETTCWPISNSGLRPEISDRYNKASAYLLTWGSAGEKNDGHVAVLLDMLNTFIEMIGNHQATANQQVVDLWQDGKLDDLIEHHGIARSVFKGYFIGINQDGKGFFPLLFSYLPVR